MQSSKIVQPTSTIEKLKKFWLRSNDVNNKKEFHAEEFQPDDVNFIMSGIFCSIAIVSLILFSIAALVRQDAGFAFTLFGFALATTIGIGAIWVTGEDWLAKHFTTLLMAILCIYLFYTGGTNGTGPIIFLVFPSVALFLQGNYIGAYSVVSLLILSSFIYAFNLLGFDNSLYEDTFIIRVLMVYVLISSLSYAFSYYKDKAEKSFLKSQASLEKGSIVDGLSGLANRVLMEKLLSLELNRVNRYFRPSSIILLKLEIKNSEQFRFIGINKQRIFENIVKVFNKVLRLADVGGRWGEDLFLIILPETKITQTQEIVNKLTSVFNNYQKLFDDQTIEVKSLITCEEIFPTDADAGYIDVIKRMEGNLNKIEETTSAA